MKKSDAEWLRLAATLSNKCTPIPTAFCVGAVIVDSKGEQVATGYSRETDPHKHAEEIAIEKAEKEKIDLSSCTLYSSLEPCGKRLSGRKTCAEKIIEVGIKCVVFGMYEPSTFVEGKGKELLEEAGVETVFVETGETNTLQ